MTLTLILPFQRLYNFLHIYLIYMLVLALEEPFFVMSICISKERIPSAPTTDNYFYSTPTISPFPDRYFFRLFELCLMFLVVAKWHLVFTFAYSGVAIIHRMKYSKAISAQIIPKSIWMSGRSLSIFSAPNLSEPFGEKSQPKASLG